MKKIYFTLIILSISTVLFAQNPEYRVEKIVQTTFYREPPTVTEKKFEYTDDKLSRVIITENGKEYDVLTYTYKKENISVNSKRIGGELNTFVLKNNLLQSYKSNKSNTFTYEYAGNQIAMLTHEDKCNQLTYSYGYKYDEKGKISTVELFNKAAGAKPISAYRFYYDADGKLQRMDQGGVTGTYVTRSYATEYAGNNISKVSVRFQDKFEKRFEFDYDENGNVTEQREFESSGEKEIKSSVMAITYAKAKGNDAIVWNTYDWMYNSLLGVRTYRELPTPCY